MSLAVQPKLLTAIETGRFRPLAGTRHLYADVRVISSSNGPVREAVGKGRFLEDLY